MRRNKSLALRKSYPIKKACYVNLSDLNEASASFDKPNLQEGRPFQETLQFNEKKQSVRN